MKYTQKSLLFRFMILIYPNLSNELLYAKLKDIQIQAIFNQFCLYSQLHINQFICNAIDVLFSVNKIK